MYCSQRKQLRRFWWRWNLLYPSNYYHYSNKFSHKFYNYSDKFGYKFCNYLSNKFCNYLIRYLFYYNLYPSLRTKRNAYLRLNSWPLLYQPILWMYSILR